MFDWSLNNSLQLMETGRYDAGLKIFKYTIAFVCVNMVKHRLHVCRLSTSVSLRLIIHKNSSHPASRRVYVIFE